MPQFQDNRFQDNLSAEDRLTYRRWVRGLFVFYSFAIALAVTVGFMSRPADDQRASNEIQIARLKAKTESIAISQPAGPVSKH
jgi:hypothetical protein